MTLIQLDHISKSYGAHAVLEHLSWQVEEGHHTGLIGPNGCGKTTLLRLILGEVQPDVGAIHRVKRIQIGYLEQEPTLTSGLTLLDETLRSFEDILGLHERLFDMEMEMATGETSDDFLRHYGELREQYERKGGYTIETRAQSVLFGLGFSDQDLAQSVDTLSGGEKSRVALAKLLVREPEVLLLDEPTNHLDLDATEWLERFLISYPGTVVIISHDRYLLDKIATEIVEIENHTLERYPGNYTAYVSEKARRIQSQKKSYEQQQAEFARTEEFIRRNIAGQKTKQAQSRRKMLARIERIERPRRERTVKLQFSPRRKSGGHVLEVQNLTKGYHSTTLFKDLTFTLRRGERLGVVGPNGAGKTTLLRILRGEEESNAGTVVFGHHTDVGYYDQSHGGLNPDTTVLEEIWSVDPWAEEEQIRDFLGRFLFSGDAVLRRVESLSGGEQSRLFLAKLILQKVNLLILDEPTNHLDIPSRMALERALSDFEGAILVVSHDRYFLNAVVKRILHLRRGNGRLYEGDYAYFAWKWEQERSTQAQDDGVSAEKQARKYQYIAKKRQESEEKRRERRFAEIETEIMGLEDNISQIDALLGSDDIASDWSRTHQLLQEREQLRKTVDKLYEEWAKLDTRYLGAPKERTHDKRDA